MSDTQQSARIACTACNRTYKNKGTLTRHQDKCHPKVKGKGKTKVSSSTVRELKYTHEITKLRMQLKECEFSLKLKDEEIAQYQKDLEYHRKMLEVAWTVAKKSTNTATCLIKEHNIQPSPEALERYRLSGMEQLQIDGLDGYSDSDSDCLF